MKKFRILSALLVLVTAIGFTSCDDESPTLGDNTGISADPNAPTMVMATGIGNFEAENVTATVSTGAISVTGSTGPDGTGNAVTMTLNKTRLRLNREYNNVALSYITPTKEYRNFNNSTGEVSGTIIITALDIVTKKISGNFSFRGWDTSNLDAEPVVFYNGKFENVLYTGTVDPEVLAAVAPADEFIKAKAAGAATITTFTNLNTEITSSQTLIVNGSNTEAPVTSVNLEFPIDIAVGDYPITQNGIIKATYTNETAVFTATEGTLKVEVNDEGLIKAKFSFLGANPDGTATIQITEGDFTTEY